MFRRSVFSAAILAVASLGFVDRASAAPIIFDLNTGVLTGTNYDSGEQTLNPELSTPLELWIDFEELTGQLRRQHLEVTRDSVIEILLSHTANSPGGPVPATGSMFLSDVIDPNDPNHVPFDSGTLPVSGTITGASTQTSFTTGPLGNFPGIDLDTFYFHDMHLDLDSDPAGVPFDTYRFTVTNVTGIDVWEDPPPNGDVPEPASVVLWGLGAAGLFLTARRRQRVAAA